MPVRRPAPWPGATIAPGGRGPAALAAARLDPQRLRVQVEELPGTGNIAVRLDYRSPVRFAPLGIVLDDLVLSGEAIMRSER